MRFKYEEQGSLAVRFLSDEGGTVSMPPATWEALGRPKDFEIVVGEIEAIVLDDPAGVLENGDELPPPPDAED
jgi:hypothetical protein